MIYFHFTPGSPQSPNTDGGFGKTRSSLLTARGGRSKWRWEEEEERGERSSCVVNCKVSSQPTIAVSEVQSSSEGPPPRPPRLEGQHEHKPWFS